MASRTTDAAFLAYAQAPSGSLGPMGRNIEFEDHGMVNHAVVAAALSTLN